MTMVSNQNSIEKLINLVKNRPPIYDYNSSERNDRDHVERLWKEIAAEMGTTIAKCRGKWASLRNAFSRHLRNEKQGGGTTALQSSRKKKTWYLADELSFLRSHLCNRRKGQGSSNFNIKGQEQDADENASNFDDDNMNLTHQILDLKNELSASEENDTSAKEDFDSSAFVEAITVTPAFESFNKIDQSHSCSKVIRRLEKEFEDRNLTFFKSVLPDFNKLSDRRQRLLKQEFLTILNKSLDEQEMES